MPVATNRRPGSGWKTAAGAAAGAVVLAPLVGFACGASPPAGESPPRTLSLLLLTLDTTRADYLGVYGAATADTPVLDALAGRGTRYARALTPSPLTLPAHASLMTGLEPPEHGVVDNGTGALDPALPTLATVLKARGYATGAFVASRVLDRRFGLDRGFDLYDDRMTAERVGEYGYPERDAAAVTTAAVAWLSRRPGSEPFYLWVHYYDPHAPYEPPGPFRSTSEEGNYRGEIAFMDREIGRLLAALGEREAVVAVVGDHGEALGEHGERGHGIFLYRASLEVPLMVAGPGVPAGEVVAEAVAIRRLAPTLLRLLGAGDEAGKLGPGLPGLAGPGRVTEPEPIYSATQMPASAYGWSPLVAFSDQRWRLIVAPRPELYDFVADPGESRNLIADQRPVAERLRAALTAYEAGLERHRAAPAPLDPELARDLRSLGYISGSQPRGGTIDPKDGVVMLTEFREAKQWLQAGDPRRALVILEALTRGNPGNVPFLTQLARAQLSSGQAEAAVATYRRAVALNPELDFLHLNLAEAFRELGRVGEARSAYQRVLELNPRSAPAWLSLAEFANRAGQVAEEQRLLTAAVAAGTASAAIHARLGQLAAAGDPATADVHYRTATELVPGWVLPWLLWGELAEARGQLPEAMDRYRRAAVAAPTSPAPLLRLGRLHLRRGETTAARGHLERAAALAPHSAEGREALRLLQELR